MIINRFPISVLVVEPRQGGGYQVFQDKAGPTKRKGGVGSQYRLKGRKERLDPQRYDNFIQGRGNKRLLILYSPSQGVFEPMSFEGFKLKADEIGWKENFMNNIQQSYVVFHKKSFFDKYMPLIMLIVFGMIMLMTFVVVRQDLIYVINQATQAVSTGSSGLGGAPLGL